MKTLLTSDALEAARIIRRGGLVAFPTETVYGLGADVFNANAVAKIFEAKMRPADNPLIAHVGSFEQIAQLVKTITPAARKLIDAFFPAPLTLVLPKSAKVPLIATAGLDTVGVRMPRHEKAREFLAACGVPVVAPSANLSGRPSPTTWQAVYEDLADRIDCILEGEATEIGLESTVVDCTGGTPLVLRAGAISLEQLRAVVPETRIYVPAADESVRSPGLKHKHYAPKARIVIGVDLGSAKRAAFIGLNRPTGNFETVRICPSVENYAREVFAFFRECDRAGIELICCEPVEEIGIGRALMDRLRRAAE
ncbi:MAG: threonylcarbamoyl-AMP synthase [Acidobacteria bacterium]|nr:threonylcarbamoyl-AMP synthase [Acidobacteriota bacterium]